VNDDTTIVCYDADYLFSVTEDRVLYANFKKVTYNIWVTWTPVNWGIAYENMSHVAHGDTVSVLAEPNNEHHF
jgi:hypothetical protein